ATPRPEDRGHPLRDVRPQRGVLGPPPDRRLAARGAIAAAAPARLLPGPRRPDVAPLRPRRLRGLAPRAPSRPRTGPAALLAVGRFGARSPLAAGRRGLRAGAGVRPPARRDGRPDREGRPRQPAADAPPALARGRPGGEPGRVLRGGD